MGKPAHILALLGLFSMGRGGPTHIITKTVGGTAKPVVSGVTVRVGMNVTLACSVVDGLKEKIDDVVWSKRTYNSSRFQPKKMLKPHKDSIVSTSEPSMLQFLPVTIQDRGTYICSDATHNQSKSVFVAVKSRKDGDNKPKRNVYYPESASPNDPGYVLRELQDSFNKQDASKVSTSRPSIVNHPPVFDWNNPTNNGHPFLKQTGNTPNYDSVLEKLLHDSLRKLDASKLSTSEPSAVNNPPTIDWSRLGSHKWPSVPEWTYSNTNKPSKFDFDIPVNNFTFPEFKYDDIIDSYKDSSYHPIPPSSTYEYKSSFRHFYYTVPVSIILVALGIVLLCSLAGRRTDRGWQRLTAAIAACSHRVCTNQRTTNPSAGCLLEGQGAGRLSVLIVHRIIAIAAASERANNAVQDDAPPSYDDSTRNPESGSTELPPSYNEALATMSSNDAANLHEAADSASVAAPDVLPMPHSGSIQQRV